MTTKNDKTARMPLAAQRIAIAEACGWADIKRGSYDGSLFGRHKTHQLEIVPDYLNDLNAMRDAEMALEPDQITDYLEWLGMCSGDDAHQVWAYVHATAAQRAEAFLLTIGKWESAK